MTELIKPALSPKRARTLWQPGQSGNPNGRPRYVREKLTKDILSDLANDWAKNGKKAISDLP
jgi:hypothetical protein